VLVVRLILAKLMWRDLSRRPDTAVYGKKRMWRFAQREHHRFDGLLAVRPLLDRIGLTGRRAAGAVAVEHRRLGRCDAASGVPDRNSEQSSMKS